MDYRTLKVGDQVTISCVRSWNIAYQGIYNVVKADKVKIVLRREGDGYERVFSVKTGYEKSYDGKYIEKHTRIEPVENMIAHNKKMDKERAINSIWSKIQNAANRKRYNELKEVFAELQEVVDSSRV